MRELCRLRIFILPLVLITQLLLLLSSIATAKAWNGRTYNRSLQISIYPTEENIYEGRDASFNCRARTTNGITYPEVRWTRYDAPMPTSAYETDGRLKFTSATSSDSGRYVCSASYGGRNYDTYAQLNVHPYGPQEFQSILPQTGICRFDERACGNNECVKSEYVCDGEPDCRDRSDEQNCPSLRSCEPNEFKCNNGRCVQKMWLCDGDDDCGDNSDELACSHRAPSDGCSANEFKCRDGRQCVPLSFHCDGTNDCQDGSDEIGCVQPTIVQPPETNKQVYAGGTFQLTCKAVAVPEPYINWRLNWGPVCDPPRCTQYSEGGLGTLTVKNAQALDQGAYTCEAINVKGRVLATPDCIVRIVNIPAPESQSKTHCNVIGSVSPVPDHTGRCQCKTLVMGLECDSCVRGAYHLHEKAEHGCLKCFCFGVTDQCQSSKWYRTKDKLILNGESRGVQISDISGQVHSSRFDYSKPGMVTYTEPSYQTMYWKLPSRFLGNKLTAYGGELAFDIQYSCPGSVNNEPLIVLKGNGITLVHRPRDPYIFTSDKTIRYAVDTYETNYEELDGRPATRENLMMVLANVEMVLIRATHCYGQQNTRLGDITWEIAVDRDTQERFALEVEHCSCPPGYIGLSCEDCAPGYERSPQGPYLGICVPVQHRVQCSSAGARSAHPGYDGRCQCKMYATGPLCDRCPPNTFHLSPRNPQGCIPCFCSGVTQQCNSASNYYRTQVIIDYNRGATDQLEITTSDAHNPFTPQSQAQITGRDITFTSFYEIPGQTLYWKMPEQFLGNKVTSYGGILKYVFRYSCTGPSNIDPDVILRGNDITLQYTNHQPTYPDSENTVEVNLFEDHWQRMDGQLATREHLLMALADLDTLLIKMNYLDDCSSSSLISVSLDYAEPQVTGGEIAYEVEQCQCPPGYVGTSCEDCAPGYSRTGGGLYLGLCERCECHGHASQCDKEHGFCIDCQHNTEGDQCERCKPGFTGDARRGTPHDCQPAATRPACMCNNHSPRGCDSFGRCLLCEHNTEGYHCEQCKRGFYGDAIRGTPFDCTPCPCPGTSDCFLDAYGQVQCRNCPAGLTGRLCEECAPGYTRSRSRARIDEGRICEPIGHVEETNIVFVPTPEGDRIRQWRLRWQPNRLQRNRHYYFRRKSPYGPPLRVQIDPPKNLNVPVGSRARWYCRVVGQRSPGIRLQWSKVGTAGLPSNAAQYDGELVIDGVQEFDSGQYRCTGSGDHQFATDDATLNVEPKARPVYGRPPPVMVDPLEQTVNVNDMATFRCWVPGLLSCELKWYKDDIGGQLPHGVYQTDGTLKIPHAQLDHAGSYICTASNEYGIGKSPPARLIVKQPQQRPRIDPQENTVAEGEPARFRCWLPGDPTAILTWKMKGNGPLPPGIQQHEGILNIASAQRQHTGNYICTASDPMGYKPPVDSPVARLIVRPANNPLIDPPEQRVSENQPVQFRCWVPGNPTAVLQWRRADGHPLGYGVSDRQGILSIARAQLSDAGEYICSAQDLYGGVPVDSSPARLHVDRLYEPSIEHSSVQPLESFQKPQVDPKHQMVYEGDPAMFRCWVPSSPNVRLKWSRADGTPLPISAYDDGTGTLYYLRAHVSDADFYVCSVIDPDSGLPIESDPVELKVKLHERRKEIVPSRGAPTVDPIEQTVEEGDPSQIRCYVPGDPNAVLKWRKQDGELPTEATQNQGILYIPQTESEDAGSYICTLEDHFGGAPSIDSVPARIHVKQQENIPLVIPASLTVNKGDLVRFLCYIPDEQTQSLRWGFKDRDGPLPAGAYVYYGVLTIKARLNDTGKYICTDDRTSKSAMPVILTVKSNNDNDAIQKLQNIHDNDEYNNHLEEEEDEEEEEQQQQQYENHDDELGIMDENATNEYDEHGNNHDNISNHDYGDNHDYDTNHHHINDYGGKPPRPIATPSDQVVKVGEVAQFHCDPNSDTPATVRWGYETPDGPLRGDVVPEGNDLIIRSADNSDAGEYICTATNPYGSGEAEPVRLHVTEKEEPPTARVVPRVWNGQHGDKHQFQCITTGSPEPTIVWTGPSGEGLPEDVTDVGGGFLDFQNARADMNGDYTCTATNIVGEASDHGSVNIGPSLTVRTSPPGPRIVLTAGEPLEVKCEAFGEPEPEVEWLHDPGPERGDLPDDFKPVTISEQFIRHPSIGVGNAGVYTCRGSNIQASAKKDIYIEVVEPSKIATVSILGSSTQWFEPGKPADLICAATGSEIIDRIQWVKIDGTLPDGAKETEFGILHLPKFRKFDSGEYECRGYRHNELVGSNRVTVHATTLTPLDVARVEIDPPMIRVIDQGESIKLTCTVEETTDSYLLTWYRSVGNDNLNQAPIILSHDKVLHLNDVDFTTQGIYWVHLESTSGESIRSRPIYLLVHNTNTGGDSGANFEWALLRGGNIIRQYSDDNTLIIKKADPLNDYGVYRCEVEDDDGELIGQAYTAVTIGFTDPSNARIVKFDEKSAATIECPVYAIPGSVVTWEKEDGDLPTGATTSGNKLMIDEFDDDAVGMYICKVDIQGKQIEGYIKAEIYVPDTIIQVLLEPSSESISLGDRAWFDCKVTGDPDAEITWTKEGEDELPDNTQVVGNRLLFVNVREDNGGIYKCHAKTKAGPLETRNVLNVGIAKRKRKRISRKKEKRAHREAGNNDKKKTKHSSSIFGNCWCFLLFYCFSVTVDDNGDGVIAVVVIVVVVVVLVLVTAITTTITTTTTITAIISATTTTITTTSYKIPSKSIQRVKESVPVIIGAVGEETEIRCPATGAPGVYGEVKWEKVSGELPYAYSIHQDILHLKDTKRTDEGVYRCITRTDSGLATVTHVHLKVSDFVPLYNGDGYMELKPLTDEQWSDINIKISFRPKSSNGLLLYTERQNESNPDEIFSYLSIGLKNGYVIYRYNVGAGPAEIKSVYPVVTDEWHKIEIFNQPNQAGLLVDEDDIVEQDNYYFNTGEGISKIINVAGTKDKATLERTTFEQPFIGTITSIIISDEKVNFGENTVTKSPNIQKDTACSLGLCQHNSICIPTNVHIGFVCDCSTAKGYEGEFCERKILKCSDVTCEVGTCEYRPDGTQFCHCPVGRYGDRCQLLDSENIIKSVEFNGETSYIVLPKSKTLRNFSLKMEIQPYSTNDQLLAYEASDYNPKRSYYLALAIRRGKFVYLYNSASGNIEIESPDEVKVNVPYHLDLKRFGNRAEFRINGTRIPSRGKLSAFLSGTNLFIGGIPSGIMVNPRIGGAASFKGCISKIVVNGKDVNLVEILKKSSHDVTICEPHESKEDIDVHVPFIWTTNTPVPTTRTTIRITTSDNSLFKSLEKDDEEWTDDGVETTDMIISYPEENLATCTGENCAVQCTPDTCGDHGDCEIINATHITCSCRDYYDGPTCEIFKPIDHAAKFDGNAFIVFSIDDFPHLTSEHEESLCLRFKTNASTGLIFWQGQQLGTPLRGDDYMSIGLNNGHLVFSYELGGGASQLVSAEKVNDGKEHQLKIWRKGRYGKMTVDDGALVTGSSFGLVAMLNVDGDIYIGGLPELDDMTGGLYTKNFVGCIADITFNGVEMDLMANAIDGRNVKPCDQWTTKKRWLRSGKYH